MGRSRRRHRDQNLYDALIDAFSMPLRPQTESGHDHFFDAFEIYDALFGDNATSRRHSGDG